MDRATMLPFALALIACACLLLAIVGFAAHRPDYSHFKNTISELGEAGATNARLVSFGVFLPVGVTLLLVAVLARAVEVNAALLAVCMGVGYAVAAIFPCDPGSPVSGSPRQAVHNLGGGVEYFGGALALWRLSEVHGSFFHVAALTVAVAGVALTIPSLPGIRGLVQRVAEVALFACLSLALWHAGGGVYTERQKSRYLALNSSPLTRSPSLLSPDQAERGERSFSWVYSLASLGERVAKGGVRGSASRNAREKAQEIT